MQNNVKYVFTHFVKYVTLDRSSAPTHYDEYLNQAVVGSGFHTRPKKITQKITSGALPDATRFDVYLNRANVGNAAPAFHGNLM